MNSDNRFNRRQQLALGTVIMLSPALRLFPSQSVIMAAAANAAVRFIKFMLLPASQKIITRNISGSMPL